MNRLSAIDAFGPAFERVRVLLFQRFQLGLWMKFGLIGILGGGLVTASTGARFPFPGMNGGKGSLPPSEMPDLGRALHSIHLGKYFPLIVTLLVAGFVIGLIFEYLFCRFRFILFDAVITGQPAIGRGWSKYGEQANRYFAFWIVFKLVNLAVMALVMGLPLWHAYKNGVFDGDGSLPALFALLASIGLGAIAVGIVFAVVSTLMKDFVMPVLALDDYTLSDAWSAVTRVASSEPGAWAGYMGLKLLCAFGTGIALTIAFLIAIIPSLIIIGIPAGIVIGLGAMVIKMGGIAAGIIICCLGGLIVFAGFFCVFMVLSAPVSVFFASYAFYFFGGRYPKLAVLLWPQQPTPPMSPLPVGVAPTAQNS